MSLRVLESTLSKWGYEVTACPDGLQAWESLKVEDPPEIAVLDWMMPGVEGPELCRRVRRSSDPTVPYIILVTGRDRSEDIVEGLDAGADDYIRKPFDTQELRARVRVGERIVELQGRQLEQKTAHYVEQLEVAVEELERSRRRIVTAQEETRKAIAERLHGPVQTRLYMLSLRLGEVREMFDTSPQQAQAALTQAAADLDHLAESEIREVSHQLHPSIIGVGLSAGMRSLRDRYERWVEMSLDIARDVVEREPPGCSTIPFNVRLGLYRVTDEALANVIRHSGATRADVRLWLSDHVGTLCLEVQDDGRGFELDGLRHGLGTVTMEDYLGALGGSLELETAPGKGTRVTATVPLNGDSGHLAAEGS